jgi:hypothetical protein
MCEGCFNRSSRPTETPSGPVCATCAHRPVRVWAGGIGTPDRYLRKDARLPKPDQGDTLFGQDGWDVCFEFANADNLRDLLGGGFKLPKFMDEKEGGFVENQITKLAIHAHGAGGAVDINNKRSSSMIEAKTATDMLNLKTLPNFASYLNDILYVLARDAKLFFMCCMTGYGLDGAKFLQEVSKHVAAKNVSVIGFTSMLYVNAGQQKRPADLLDNAACTYPGCRETNDIGPNGQCTKDLEGDKWKDLVAYPWASDRSRRAMVARGGVITKVGEFPNPPGSDPSGCIPSSYDGKCHDFEPR